MRRRPSVQRGAISLRAYGAALEGWRKHGVADPALLKQAEHYGALLRALAQHAPGDLNRQELWEPVLALGCIAVTGGAPSAIIAPWHPLRFAASAVKARSVAGLAAHLLSADQVNFGDSRLFFADLRAELAHPYYPEIAVGYHGAEPVLLAETSTINDYSLMECPVRDPSEAATVGTRARTISRNRCRSSTADFASAAISRRAIALAIPKATNK